MAHSRVSVVAQLLYAEPPLFNFARLVADLQSALHLGNCAPGTLTWDCDDLAMLDMSGTRFLMSMATAPEVPCAACLSISVGPVPGFAPSAINVTDLVACQRIVQRILRRSSPDQILWHEVADVVDATVIDTLVSRVEPLKPVSATPIPQTAMEWIDVAALPIDAVPHATPEPDTRHPDCIKLARARAALWPIEPAKSDSTEPDSVQMRLAAHAMDATMLVVALPVGAVMMALNLHKGADVRLSARMLAVTGTLLTVLQSPFTDRLVTAI